MWILDPGWKDSDPESGMEKIRIRDKHPGSATLLEYFNLVKKPVFTNHNEPKMFRYRYVPVRFS
jgi:hypothetical protein